MKIIKLKEFKELEKLYGMWNEEFGFIFPITEELFNKNVVEYGDNIFDESFVALVDNEAVGFIIGKTWSKNIVVPTYDKTGWVSLIYVKPKFRKQGIGSKLLEKVEEIFESKNLESIFLGKDYYNFFPGLPVDLKYFRPWFEKRGFVGPYDTNDLIKKVSLSTKKEVLAPFKDGKNYTIRRANLDDYENLGNLIKKNWPGRWYLEFLDYFAHGGTGYEYMVCLDEDGIICGFCKVCDYDTPLVLAGYSLNFHGRFERIGGIGPLGVDVDYRRRNIANNILKQIVNELIDRNTTDIIIDWTNLMHIYRNYGFEIWKSYTYYEKKIKK